ncbi:hypothetical protein ACSNOH_09685 [Streptomyces sp. URMC 127]|uniref:hypothetical protein n=1 Tax=Streptomyces sp. URMC 127 TaxID=3423402 RepID=UPI003F1A69B3
MITGYEGVSCTGKTSVIAEVAAAGTNPLVVPCYYHAAPDPALLPDPVAATAREQLEGLAVLLGVEDRRRKAAEDADAAGRDVLLDRTVDTLLAHTYAIAQLHGRTVMDQARQLVRDSAPLLPDLTIVLHADPGILAGRAARRPGMPPVFYAPEFTAHFEAYFRHQALTPRCIHLDSSRTTTRELASAALRHITQARGDGAAR